MPLTTRKVPYLECDGLGCGTGELADLHDQYKCPPGWMWYRALDDYHDNSIKNVDSEPVEVDKFYCHGCAKRMMNPAIPGGRRTHEPQLDPSELSTVPGLVIR